MKNTPFYALAKRAALILPLLALILTVPAQAQQRMKAPSVIRDSEIESVIKRWAEPVIRAARLDPGGINIIIVNDKAMNAFVAGGPNIFIYTGLLMKTDNASEVVGVIAHELGHISGGHLVRAQGAMANASYESVLGTLLGIGAAVLTGEGGLGAAISAGTRNSAIGRLLAFSRVQESSADQAALTSLEKAGISPSGLLSFMEKLEDQELLPASQQAEYVRTHPLTRNRVEALRAGLERSPSKGRAEPDMWAESHARIIAKLTGYLTPEQVAWKYDMRDESIPARYARAVAAYRQNKVAAAIAGADGLIAAESDNPFFFELKGQMLADFGRVGEALPAYRRAAELHPADPLILTAYAGAQIESARGPGAQKQLQEAVANLKEALGKETRSPRIHRLLATAYGRLSQEPMAKLHLAEEALLKGDIKYAMQQAEIAAKGLPQGKGPWLRAQDIIDAGKRLEKEG